MAKKLKICKYYGCSTAFMPAYSTQKYCSYKCYWKDMKGKHSLRKLPREVRICALPECNTTFERSITASKRYCSRICARKDSRGKPLIFKNPKERGKKIAKTKKGMPSWCRGLTKEMDERVAKRTENQKGKPKHTTKSKKKIGVKNSKNTERLWKDPEYRKKQLKAILKGLKLLPNKPEKFLTKLLQRLFPNQWKYIGDGKDKNSIIAGKCPDFIHVNQKKIIEFNGSYWHGEKLTGRTKEEEEQQRIGCFAKEGYQTLIIWEHELEDIKKLIERITKFCRQMKS